MPFPGPDFLNPLVRKELSGQPERPPSRVSTEKQLNRRVVVGPGILELVRKFVNIGCSRRSPHQNSCCSCTESTNRPNQAFHDALFLLTDVRSVALDARLGGRVSRLFFEELARLVSPAGGTGFRRANAGGYTSRMDAVRFGRALGFGARQAVKTVATAVDAATAENPAAKAVNASANTDRAATTPTRRAAAAQAAARPAPRTSTAKAAQTVAQTVAQSRHVRQGLKSGTRRFGEAVWRPFVRLSGVLWLEVAGVFFGIFALYALGHLWELRGEWHSAGIHGGGLRSLVGAVAMLVFFGYFCVSSFVRARRRERRR